MSSANLQKVIEEVKSLTPDEQRQVRKLLDELLDESTPTRESDSMLPEDLLQQRLFEAGLILEIRKQVIDPNYKEFEPIEVKGKPLSETIVEERR